MGWRNSLDLFLSAKRVLGIFQTEAEEQVTENGLPGLTIKPHELVTLRKLARYSFYGGLPACAPRSSCIRAKGLKKLPFAPPMAKAEHVKHGREHRRKVEILYRDRQGLLIVPGPNLAGHVTPKHIFDNGAGGCQLSWPDS